MFVLLFLLTLSSSIKVITTEIDVSGINGEELKDAYHEMNVQLVKEVPSCDIEATINAAKSFLSKSVVKNNGRWMIEEDSSKLNEAYKLFVALSQFNGENRCYGRAIDVLKQNDLASGERIHSALGSTECRKRVEKVLLDYASKVKKMCPKVHSNLMRDKLITFNKNQLQYMHLITDSSLTAFLNEFKQGKVPKKEAAIKLAFHPIDKMFTILTNDFYHHLKGLLDKVAPEQKVYLKPHDDESTGLKKLDEDKLKKLFNEYGMEPCKAFVAAFGADIYEPEIYLSTFGHEPLEGDDDFYLNWARYNMCKVHIRNEEKLWRDVEYCANL